MTSTTDTDTPNSTTKNYVCAIGAALAVSIFDAMQNKDTAALKKAGLWFAEFLVGGGPATAMFGFIAMSFFAAVSALLVMAYKPTATKEAFLLGLSVLAVLNTAIKTPSATQTSFLMSNAYAQTNTNALAGLRPVDVWLLISGPPAVPSSDITLTVYSADRGAGVVLRRLIRAIDKLQLMPGKYNFELSSSGYRSVVFSGRVEQEPIAFTRIIMRDTDFDQFVNIFGPELTKATSDTKLGSALRLAKIQCDIGDQAAAQAILKSLSSSDFLRFANDEPTIEQYCYFPRDKRR